MGSRPSTGFSEVPTHLLASASSEPVSRAIGDGFHAMAWEPRSLVVMPRFVLIHQVTTDPETGRNVTVVTQVPDMGFVCPSTTHLGDPLLEDSFQRVARDLVREPLAIEDIPHG